MKLRKCAEKPQEIYFPIGMMEYKRKAYRDGERS